MLVRAAGCCKYPHATMATQRRHSYATAYYQSLQRDDAETDRRVRARVYSSIRGRISALRKAQQKAAGFGLK